MEVPDHCIRSVLEIRAMLTQELGQLTSADELVASLRALRAACRKFLDTIQPRQRDIEQYGFSQGHWASEVFLGALGEMRGVFGVYLAILAAKFGLSVEGEFGGDYSSEGR